MKKPPAEVLVFAAGVLLLLAALAWPPREASFLFAAVQKFF